MTRYSWPPFSDQNSPTKRDTIPTKAIFSFNGRRLVTSLILVITTIILLILLIVNLNCNIFTEATVNTTTAAAAAAAAAAPTTATSASGVGGVGSSTSVAAPVAPPASTITNTQNHPTQVVSGQGVSPAANLGSDLTPASTLKSPTLVANASPASGTKAIGETGLLSSIGTNSDEKPIITKSTVLAEIKNSNDGNELTPSSNGIMADMTTTTATTTAATTSIATDMANSEKRNFTADGHEAPCVTDTIPNGLNNFTASQNGTSKYFDINYAIRSFEESMLDKDSISLSHYINGFKELMKFFNSLGTIFLFVTSDLESKIGLLEGYRNTERGGCNPAYLTIQSSIEYETEQNLLRDSKRPSGARTILRLHRALEFLSSMMSNISKLDEEAETAPAARDAYTNTLAKHHPWTIRTIASFAMRTLPIKKVLVESVLGRENSMNVTSNNERMVDLANVTQTLFDVVDKFYEERSLKDLP